jgi:large subunit ribosomal protein L17
MRHGFHKAQLNRPASARRALFASLASALIKERQIRTTIAKAKAMRPFVERMITFAKKGDLASRRHVLKFLRQKSVVKELFDHIGPFYANRQGGYTRIMKLGVRRGDAAPLAIIEFVDREGMGGQKEETKKEAAKKTKKKAEKAAAASKPEEAK